MKKLILLFLIILNIATVLAQKQNITFNHLTTDDGLSQFSVNSLYVDEQGVLWIGTREGLNRYNGSDIKTFKLQKNNPNSLFCNTVLRITGDQQGKVFLLCTEGVAEFDLITQKFTTLLQGNVTSIYFNKRLFIGKKDEVYVYNKETRNFDLSYHLAGKDISISCLHLDDEGSLWMGTEMVIVNENWSMPECLKEMRIQAEDMDEIYYVYVVDDDERLRGVFPLKKMITSPSVSKVKHVMKKDPISVHVDTPIDEVVQLIEKYDLVAVPVVDSIGRLVGRITVDDVMDEVREQAERDYQLASGLSQDVETDDSVFRQTTARLPWLLIGMIGGIGNSMILGNFDSTFAAHPEMALYIPLIGGTGGNVGTQSSALVVQGLANSSLDAHNTWKQIVKESVVAVINATIISMLVYIYNFIRFGATATVSYSVSVSLFAVVMFASIFGTLVPMTLEKLKIDPAIATGPFISITNDIIGMMLYMGITVLLS